jgi:hypothetical protein
VISAQGWIWGWKVEVGHIHTGTVDIPLNATAATAATAATSSIGVNARSAAVVWLW